MIRRFLTTLTMLALPATVAAGGCGSDDTSGGKKDAGDGKYHPPPNGVHTSEDGACTTLVGTYSDLLMQMGCVGTGRPCPDFLRAAFTTECMQYDQGSVDGCVAYYKKATSCDALNAAFGDCVVTPYPGTEPAGCP